MTENDALPALPADLAGLVEKLQIMGDETRRYRLHRNHCRTAREAASALEALAGRQVAVPEGPELEIGEGVLTWRGDSYSITVATDEATLNVFGVGARRIPVGDELLEAIPASAAPLAPQAAEEPTYAAVNADRVEIHNAQTRIGGLEDIGYGPWLFEDDTYSPTPPASGKVEAEAIQRYNVDVEKNHDGYWEGVLHVSAGGEWVRHSDHTSTVATMQAEIERLRRHIRLHAGDTISLNNEVETMRGHWEDAEGRAEAAEAELAKLRDRVAQAEHALMVAQENINRTDWRETSDEVRLASTRIYLAADDYFRALLKGETEATDATD